MARNSPYPDIDLSLVTFNSARWIEDFFSSLCAQSYPLNKIHVFIRDNGSTDGTISLLEDTGMYEKGFASLQLESGQNVGFGQGHNANLRNGHSPYFLVSNLDLRFETDAITRIVVQALSDEATVASWEFRQKPFEHPKCYDPVTMQTKWSSSACVLFRREAIVRVGGYEPRIFMYGEDVELSYRLRAEGYVLKYHPYSVCWHYTYGAIGEVKPLQFIGSKLGNAYIRLRYGNWWQVLEIIPLFMALLFLPQRFSGQRIGILKAYRQLLCNARYFLASRKSSIEDFPFNYFDYECSRLGAFYENLPLPSVLPLVSVLIHIAKDHQACLDGTIASVLNQTYPNIELIVVEDGSASYEKFIWEIAARGVLRSVKYSSIAAAEFSEVVNLALTGAQGEFICFLNDDGLFFADHIEVLVQELLVHDDIGAAYGAVGNVTIANERKDEDVCYNLANCQYSEQMSLSQADCVPCHTVLFRKILFGKCVSLNNIFESIKIGVFTLNQTPDCKWYFVSKLTSLCRIPRPGSKGFFSDLKRRVGLYAK